MSRRPTYPRAVDYQVFSLVDTHEDHDACVRSRRQWPPDDMDGSASALRIVEKARKRAWTGARGQLSPARSGLLVLGGYGLSDEDLDLLEAAARTMLDAKKRAHLLGVGIVSVGSVLEQDATQRAVSSVLAVRVAANPHYAGALTLETGGDHTPASPIELKDFLPGGRQAP